MSAPTPIKSQTLKLYIWISSMYVYLKSEIDRRVLPYDYTRVYLKYVLVEAICLDFSCHNVLTAPLIRPSANSYQTCFQ